MGAADPEFLIPPEHPYRAYFEYQRSISREADQKRLVQTDQQKESAYIVAWCMAGALAVLLFGLAVTRFLVWAR